MTPPKAPKRARSGTKARVSSRPASGMPYPAEVKAAALEVLRSDGMAAAHASTGVAKATLHRWAKAAGIDLGAQARARTATATEAVRARAVEVKLSTVALLEGHLAQAGDYLATIAGVNALAAQMLAQLPDTAIERKLGPFGPYIEVDQTTQAAQLVNLAQAIDALPLATRDAEGMVTRAIHDLQLLNGEATERGELVVDFAVPRPVPLDPASVQTYDTQE